jgi:hypothetical protein
MEEGKMWWNMVQKHHTSVIFLAWMLSLAKVPPDGRYQFHALFPDWNGPVGNLGPAPSGAFSFTCEISKSAKARR